MLRSRLRQLPFWKMVFVIFTMFIAALLFLYTAGWVVAFVFGGLPVVWATGLLTILVCSIVIAVEIT